MGKFYFAFAWDIIVNLHVCICKNKICIWSDPGVNLPICKYTPVCICVRMRHLLTPSKICTPEYIYTCVFLAHANWTLENGLNTSLLEKNEPLHGKTNNLHRRKQRRRSALHDQRLCFATQIVQFLYFLNPKVPGTNHLL